MSIELTAQMLTVLLDVAAEYFLRINQERPHRHLSFGFDIHNCIDHHLAEMQIKIFFVELLSRRWRTDFVGEAVQPSSLMFRMYSKLRSVLRRSRVLESHRARRSTHAGFRCTSCRAMMMRCISLVPSPISSSGASRK